MVRLDELRKKLRAVSELEKLRRQIKNDYLSKKVASSGFSDYTTRLLEPVIASQAKQVEKLDKLQEERIKKLEANQQLMIEGISDKLGAIEWNGEPSTPRKRVAPASLVERSVASRESKGAIYGLELKNDTYMIGDRVVSISDDDTELYVGDKVFKLTPGVIHLLTSNTKPSNSGVVEKRSDVRTYLEIIAECGLEVSKSSDKYKLLKWEYGWVEHKGEWMTTEDYEKILEKKSRDRKERAERAAWNREIREERREERKEEKRERMGRREPLTRGSESEGSGLLPSNANSMLTMVQYRLGSYQAGNHALRNEIVDISDELYRQKAIDSIQYKHISKIVANASKKKIR